MEVIFSNYRSKEKNATTSWSLLWVGSLSNTELNISSQKDRIIFSLDHASVASLYFCTDRSTSTTTFTLAADGQQREEELQSIFPTAHNAFDSEVQVTCELMTVHCSCWEYFIFRIHLLQLFSFTPFPCFSLSTEQHHPFFSFVSVTHLLIQLTKMVENYLYLSWVSCLLQCVHKFTHCGAR